MELNLQEIRKDLDAIDSQIVDLFSRRMRLVKNVADYKKEHGLPVLDAGREETILNRVSEKAGEALAPYARRVYETMFAVSREYQAERLKGGER